MGRLSKASRRKKKRLIYNRSHIKRHSFLFACFFVLVTLFMSSILITPQSTEINEETNSSNDIKYPSVDDGTQYTTSGISTLGDGDSPIDPTGTGTALSNVNEYLANDTALNNIPVNNTGGSDYTGNESIYVSPLDGAGRKDLVYFNFTTYRIANATEDTEPIEDGYTTKITGTSNTQFAQELNISTSGTDYYYLTEVKLTFMHMGSASGWYDMLILNSTDGLNPKPNSSDVLAIKGQYSPGTIVDLSPSELTWELESERLLLQSDRSYFIVVEVSSVNEVDLYYVNDNPDPDYGLAYTYDSGLGWLEFPDIDFSVEHAKYQEAFYADTTTDGYDDLNMNVTVYGAGVNGPYDVNPAEGGSGEDWWIGGQVSQIFSPGDVSPTASGTFEFDIDVDDSVSARNLTIDFNVTIYYFWDATTSTGNPTYNVLNETDVSWT